MVVPLAGLPDPRNVVWIWNPARDILRDAFEVRMFVLIQPFRAFDFGPQDLFNPLPVGKTDSPWRTLTAKDSRASQI